MKNLKTGIVFIIVGNVLNLLSDFSGERGVSDFGDLIQGILVGMSVALNVIGIILILIYWSKLEKEETK